LHDARLEHVGKADEKRQADAALAYLVDELLEVCSLLLGSAGVNDHVPSLVDREVAVRPAADAVELLRIGNRPTLRDPGRGEHRHRNLPLLPSLPRQSAEGVLLGATGVRRVYHSDVALRSRGFGGITKPCCELGGRSW